MEVGILLEVDPSINTVIVQIDEQEYGKYIIQQLDDEHILINKDKVKELKEKVQAVRIKVLSKSRIQLTHHRG